MAIDRSWSRTPARGGRAKSAGGSIACMVFVAAMSAAFWAGAIWASHNWLP